ncbi:threonine--tRNA ligase [Candidatus Kuenenbacteria bacterium]|nr:threonine--tRNA ligase [Candidatus Kuenenbacteria bacterium]
MKKQSIEIIRHSLAHIMAAAVLKLWPNTKFAIGPAIENGFYYDLDFNQKSKVKSLSRVKSRDQKSKPQLKTQNLTPDDLLKIEEEMKNIIKADLQFVKSELPIAKALAYEKKRGQIYKEEMIKELKRAGEKSVSYYKLGEFDDLCRGPHIESSNQISLDSFKLEKIAGAYWRGDEKNKMLTRIYGLAFENKKELENYLKVMEEAEKRDHRKIGKEQDLFSFHQEGPGFIFWHPKGMLLREALMKPYDLLHKNEGYDTISTPILLSEEMWHRSGHWEHYKNDMFFVKTDEGNFAIKPMNCPGSILIYNTRPRSYKEFPIKYAEKGEVHRHEPSGTLHGLFRVRAFRQDDSHIFTLEEQVEEEIKKIVSLALKFYIIFGFSNINIEVSTRPKNSIGSDEIWNKSEKIIKKVLKDLNLNYKINEGDGAFYGPKIDFHIKDCIGRPWQCGTIQLDFSMPERFDLKYIDKDGKFKRPVMIHRTIIGSIQRFTGVLIEHYAGVFPVWLSPVQVKIISVGSTHVEFCHKLADEFKQNDIRVEVDESDETVGNKIRKAVAEKIPYMLVIGDREMSSDKLTIRDRGEKTTREIGKQEFIKKIQEKIKNLK